MDSSLAAPVTTAVFFFLLRKSELCTLRRSLICSKLWQHRFFPHEMQDFHGVPSLSLADVLCHDEHGFIAPYSNLYLHAGLFEQALLLQLVTKERMPYYRSEMKQAR